MSLQRAASLPTDDVGGDVPLSSSRSDEPLRTKLVELALQKPRYGYGRLQAGGTEWEASNPQATASDLNEADR